MLKILIADDHAVVRRGLRQIVAETSDLSVAGEATNSREVLEHVRSKNYDVLVLDITMPGRSGLDILKEIKAERPRLPVIVLTMHAEEQFASRVLKAGAAGYLHKESAPEELVKAIRKVQAGGKYISPSQAEHLLDLLGGEGDRPPHEQLSDREFEVLRLMASGRTVSQVGVQLKLSVKTISTYRSRILEKMKMQSNAELTHYAIKTGLVE